MNKLDLINKLSKKMGTSKISAEKAIQAFTEIITEALVSGDKVMVYGFGTFEIKRRKEREGKNPKTSEVMTIPAYKVPKFKAGKNLKDALNG